MQRAAEDVQSLIRSTRLIALMRGFPPEIGLRLVEAYAKGGIRAVEFPFDQCNPDSWSRTADTIRSIVDRFGDELVVGAGTVLNEKQLSLAEEAGASFVVAPNVNPTIIRATVQRGLVSIAGAMTPTEAVTAHEAGASFVKIFPANVLGPAYVKAVCAPLGHIPMLAFAGITLENVQSFLEAGCVGVGVGGCLTDRRLIEAGRWDEIREIASRFVAAVSQWNASSMS